MSTITLPFTEARNRLTELVDNVNSYFSRFVITLRGRPKAVLMSKEEYDSLMETLNIMSDKELMGAIREGERDFKAKRTVDWDDIKSELDL